MPNVGHQCVDNSHHLQHFVPTMLQFSERRELSKTHFLSTASDSGRQTLNTSAIFTENAMSSMLPYLLRVSLLLLLLLLLLHFLLFLLTVPLFLSLLFSAIIPRCGLSTSFNKTRQHIVCEQEGETYCAAISATWQQSECFCHSSRYIYSLERSEGLQSLYWLHIASNRSRQVKHRRPGSGSNSVV